MSGFHGFEISLSGGLVIVIAVTVQDDHSGEVFYTELPYSFDINDISARR